MPDDTAPDDTEMFAHCGRCGEPGVVFDGTIRHDCPSCGWRLYRSPVTAVAAILTLGDRFVFSRRSREPARGLLDLPGGFVDPGESAEQAMARELNEELGIHVVVEASHYLGSLPNTYPYRGITYRTVDLFYRIPLAEAPERFDTSEISELLVLTRDEIDPATIGLASIRRAVDRWILA